MSNSVRDRSGLGLPPKAERRALGKAAAAKRAGQRRRQHLLQLTGKIGGSVLAVLIVIGGIWWLNRPDAPTGTNATASADADPQLSVRPVVTAGTGTVDKLLVTTLIAGTGAPVAANQSITVNYVGVTYADGKEFDASWDKGQPFTFTVGAGRVIDGWDQGLIGVTVGSRVQLDIPADLAYGENPTGGGPPGALRFVVDVLAAQ